MTYCLGIMLESGMVCAGDSRTNAGVDSVSTFRKLHVFERPGKRLICVLTAGNLAVTQSVITLIDEEGLNGEWAGATIHDVATMYEAAKLVGDAVRSVIKRDGPHIEAQKADASASFIVAGQIKGRRMRMFQVYSAGNFVEATEDTPYFQIGEHKYGKPILERVVTPSLDLVSAAKCAVVSLDSTIRSNISVALPVDILIYEKDTQKAAVHHRITDQDAYYQRVHKEWGEGLRSLFDHLPAPNWTRDVDCEPK